MSRALRQRYGRAQGVKLTPARWKKLQALEITLHTAHRQAAEQNYSEEALAVEAKAREAVLAYRATLKLQ